MESSGVGISGNLMSTSTTGENNPISATEIYVDRLPRPGEGNYMTIRVLKSKKKKRRKATSSSSSSSHRPAAASEDGGSSSGVKVILIDVEPPPASVSTAEHHGHVYRQCGDTNVGVDATSACVRNGRDDDDAVPEPSVENHKNAKLKSGSATFGSAKKELAWARYRERRRKVVSCLKRTVAFLLSTVGLSICMVFYTIFGGFIFAALEAPYERRIKSGVRDSLDWHVERLWNLTESLNVLHQQNWTELAESILDNYTRQVFIATKIDGWDGKDLGGAVGGGDGDGAAAAGEEGDASEVDLQWSFAGSMLYSVTVVTTIGQIYFLFRSKAGSIFYYRSNIYLDSL